MKIIPALFTLAFIGFSALQWNDPDPAPWMAAYGSAAVMSALAYRNCLPALAAFPSVAVYGAGAVYLWPSRYEGLTGTMEGHPSVELARESLGLVICAVGVLICFYIQPRRPHEKA